MKYPLNTFLAIVSMATLTHTAMAGPLMNSDLDRDGYDNYLDFDTDGDGLPDDFEKDNNFRSGRHQSHSISNVKNRVNNFVKQIDEILYFTNFHQLLYSF